MRCPVLIGRDEELGELTRGVRHLGAGAGGLWLVLGEAGVGKSRLVAEVGLDAGTAGLTVLAGRAVEGSQLPYRAITEVLLAAQRAGARPAAPELAAFRSALNVLVSGPERAAGSGPAELSALVVAEGVLRLLSTLATPRRPVLAIVEDLHYAAAETVRVVEYLADHLAGERIGCLATVRTGEPSEALTVARSLSARRAAPLFELGRLTGPDVARMTAACLGGTDPPAELAEFVKINADGLPFFVEELLADAAELTGPLVARAPAGFAASVHRRVADFAGPSRRVVRAAALLGRRFEWTLLAPTTGLAAEAVDAALRRAMDAQLVEASPGPGRDLRFRHALTRAAVLADIPPVERADLAGRGVAAIEAAHPDLAGQWCELTGRLADEAGDLLLAAQRYLEAGRRALRVGALTTAVELLELARDRTGADHGLSAQVQEALLEALALRGDIDRVTTTSEALLRTLDRIDAVAPRYAEAHLRVARADVAAQRWVAAIDQLDCAASRLVGCSSVELDCRADVVASQVAAGQGRWAQSRELATEALAGATKTELPEIACEALEVIGRADRPVDVAAAAAAFHQALRTAERAGLGLWRARALQEIATIDLLRRYRPEPLEQALLAAHEAGATALAVDIDVQLAALYALRFEPDRALPIARRCVTAARRLGLGSLPMALIRVGLAHAIRGDREAMQAAVDEALALTDHPAVGALTRACQAHYWLLTEQRARAARLLEEAVEMASQASTVPPGPFRPLWALLCAVERVDARRDSQAVIAAARTPDVLGTAVGRGLLGYASAVTAGRSGDGSAAQAQLDAADGEFAGMDGEQGYQHLGRRLVAEAAITDGWGQPAAWLADAAGYFDARGIERVATACRSLLRRAGVRVPRRGRGDSAVPETLRAQGVTSREVDVLALVADGLSNREIGDRLFVSHRTVDSHVQSLLAKTGSHSRAQLATLAADAGLA